MSVCRRAGHVDKGKLLQLEVDKLSLRFLPIVLSRASLIQVLSGCSESCGSDLLLGMNSYRSSNCEHTFLLGKEDRCDATLVCSIDVLQLVCLVQVL